MKVYIIAIGGTGMRCLEAFTHLCAVGMASGHEIEVLTLDTDINNGNRDRAERVVENYIRINSGKKLKDSFFSAKMKLYKFSPKNKTNFREMCKIATHPDRKVVEENAMLSELFFDGNAREFNLEHGYRAQTQIGSYLMYNSILDEVDQISKGQKPSDNDSIKDFLESLKDTATNQVDPVRVFLTGSVFGGTGASSIPVIPQALNKAVNLLDKDFSFGNSVIYGGTLLTQYFTFATPAAAQLGSDKIIAAASKFPFNTQAALKFYEQDATVKKLYKRLYLLGWPTDHSNFQKGKSVITGGMEQTNPSHTMELFSAVAAFDFLFGKDVETDKHQVLYRSAEKEGSLFKLGFGDFFGGEKLRKEFKKRFGTFYALSHLIALHGNNSVRDFLNHLSKNNEVVDLAEVEMSAEEGKTIDEYLHRFGISYGDALRGGWIRETALSNGEEFLFSSAVYQNDVKELKKVNWGELYKDESHHAEVKGPLFGSKKADHAYDSFVKYSNKNEKLRPDPEEFGNATNPLRFLNYMYKALSSFYKF